MENVEKGWKTLNPDAFNPDVALYGAGGIVERLPGTPA